MLHLYIFMTFYLLTFLIQDKTIIYEQNLSLLLSILKNIDDKNFFLFLAKIFMMYKTEL